MFSRIKFEFGSIVGDIYNKIPQEMFESEVTTFVDIQSAGLQFIIPLVEILRKKGHSDDNIRSRVYAYAENDLYLNYVMFKYKDLPVTYKLYNEKINMKFNVVLGNPPYQDGGKDGGQNKIYNDFSKKALEIVKDDGLVCFITPNSILKKNKRFSLTNVLGLRYVNFTINEFFNVGVGLCYWLVDKKYIGDVEVVTNSGTNYQKPSNPIYNSNDLKFIEMYTKLKNITNKPIDRMFGQNAVDTKTGRRMSVDNIFRYSIYKIDKNVGKKLIQYNKPKPKFFGELKVIIPMTKTLTNTSIFMDVDDYDVAYLCLKVENQKQVDNIKSFLLSDYFISHSNKWKELDGYGYNYALKHLPPFNINIEWTSSMVKEFIENNNTIIPKLVDVE